VAREIIPSARWQQLGEEDKRLARSAANRALLDARHTGLRAEFRTWDPKDDREALASHLIDEDMWHDLVSDDSGSFLRRRAGRVQAFVSSFLSERAGLGAPRLRSVASYLDTEPELDGEGDIGLGERGASTRDPGTP
jgi:hypothetical protein